VNAGFFWFNDFFKILNFSGEENSMKINPYQPVNKQTVGQTAGQ